jgi:RNA polymerase sigma factor (sigma-70 family)
MQTFEEAWAEHAPAVVRLVTRTTHRNLQVIDDLVQTTALKAWAAWPPETNTRAWLLRIAGNTVIDSYPINDRRRGELVGDGELIKMATPVIDKDFERSEEREALHPCLLALDDRLRFIVIAHERDGYTIEEIASALGISNGRVRNYLRTAKGRLKKCLEARGYLSE